MFLRKIDIEEIEMDLTGTCNLQCPLCTRNYKHAKHMIKKNVRLFKDIKKQLDEFSNLKRFFIAGAVSEPTLYPDFFTFIHYLN
jgi:MoaA/NifB/PqqE/SkfB family radical SAM enzyme